MDGQVRVTSSPRPRCRSTLFVDISDIQRLDLDPKLGCHEIGCTGAGKHLLTGESLFMTMFTHTGQGKARVAFDAPYPGNIIPVSLSNVGGSLIYQKDSFLCAARGVSIGFFFQKKILTGLFGGEGFFYAILQGPGKVWLQSLPFSRLAGRMLAAAAPGGRRDEGSILGPIGGLIDGD